MSKGRATAAYSVGYDVRDSELHITVNVPSTSDDMDYKFKTVNGSVALGKFVAQLGVKYASVPTKAYAEQLAQFNALKAAGKTDEQADDIMVVFYPEWTRE